MKQTTVIPEQAERIATIRLGESTRTEVRSALGEPVLENGFWRVELYRVDDMRTELGFMVAIVVPVPVGVFHEKRHGYVLVTYDNSGRVSKVSSGVAGEGMLASDAERWPVIRADEIVFAVDSVRNKIRSTLLADASRLSEYVEERGRASGCTLMAACDTDQGCPNEVAVDDEPPFDPSPMTVLCTPEETCPRGSPIPGGEIDGKSFLRVPVIHAVNTAPGTHRVRVTSSVRKGSGEATFSCDAGDVVYGIVRSHLEGATWWSKGRLEATVMFSNELPVHWDSYSLVLHRDGFR